MSYRWKILRVNLSSQEVKKEPLNKAWTKKYFGGRGLGAKNLYEELPKRVDALSPENKIVIATGPFTGTSVPCSGKLAILGKSPATGAIVDSSVGGTFAAQLKYAGYDLLIIDDQSQKPVYLVINDNRVEINDAENLWGKGVVETEAILHEKFGANTSILSIGPAGENLIPFACIGSGNRQSGRSGIGAITGYKKLKAIVCSGSQDLTVPDMPLFM